MDKRVNVTSLPLVEMLVEPGLSVIERDVETAERALSARRSDWASEDTLSTR
jgi:hypothetical protein